MDYLIVSAATAGSRYVQCLERQKVMYAGKRYMGLIVPDRGSWGENTKLKPIAIMEGFKHSNVVLWLDSDCTIDPPESLPTGNWDMCTMHNVHPRHKIKTSAGFLLFRDTAATRRFLAVWEAKNKTQRKDHPAMMAALALMAGKMNVMDMTTWLNGRHIINALAPERGVIGG